MMQYGNTIIHIDPFSRLADYATLPKADLILITMNIKTTLTRQRCHKFARRIRWLCLPANALRKLPGALS